MKELSSTTTCRLHIRASSSPTHAQQRLYSFTPATHTNHDIIHKPKQGSIRLFNKPPNSSAIPFPVLSRYLATQESQDMSGAKEEYQLKRKTLSTLGTEIDLSYIDEGPKDGPVMMTVHGVPGGAKDFTNFVEPLTQAGIRTVLLNLPDHPKSSVADESKYDHRTEHRAKVVAAMIKSLKTTSPVILLSHSAGWSTLLHVAAQTDLVKGCVFLCNGGYTPHNVSRPYWAHRTYSFLLRLPLLGGLLALPLPSLYKMWGFKEVGSPKTLAAGLHVVAGFGYDAAKVNGGIIRDKGIPALFAFTKRDRIIEWQKSMELVKLLDTPTENILKYNDEGKLETDDTAKGNRKYPRVHFFNKGSHVIHKSYPDIIIPEVIDLFNFVKKL